MAGYDNDQDEFDDSWMLNLQEFIDSLEPAIHDLSTPQELSELLLNLEATDANFHRYNFIQQIKDKLDGDLGPMIDNAADNFELKSADNVSISEISGNILESKEFLVLSNVILEKVKTAAEHITENISSESFDFSDIPKTDSKETFYYNDGSVCSTSDGVDFMFMSPDRYKSLAKEIDHSKPLAIRLNALSILQQVPQTDLVASDAWKSTRKGLFHALDDNVEEINLRALKFLSRLFVCGSSHVAHEYFLILIENLIEYFRDDTSHMISIDSGLDLGDRRNVLLLRKFRLLNQIQQELPGFWLRYSEKYIEEITEKLLELLEIVPTPISDTVGKNLLTPLHFLSLLDPQATWFKRWMHGHYGRTQLINIIPTYKNFLIKQVECCMKFPRSINEILNNEIAHTEEDDYLIFSYKDISYVYFLHALSIISRLMLYNDGRRLFSFTVNQVYVDVQVLLAIFVDILKACPLQSLNVSKSLYHPIFVIVDIFRSFTMDGCATCQKYLCNDELCKLLVSPIKDIIEGSKINEPLINIVAEILTDIAHSHLLSTSKECNASVIHVIAKALDTVFTSKSQYSNTTLGSLLSLCREIYCTPSGLITLKNYNISMKVSTCLLEYKNQTETLINKIPGTGSNSNLKYAGKSSNPETIAYKRALKFEREYLDYLLSFAASPKGVGLIVQTGQLDECVLYMYDRYYINGQEDIVKFDYGAMLNQIAATESGIISLQKSGYVSDLLHETWLHLEGYNNDYKETVLSDVSEDFLNRVSKKLYTFIICLLSSFPAVKQLFCRTLTHAPSDEIANGDTNDFPVPDLHSFYDFMHALILLNSEEKRTALYHPEETHIFGLNVLSSIVTCLDSMLYLQTHFNFQDILLSMQDDCKHGQKDFILDQCSLKRNEILVKSHLLGGCNERIIPPDNLIQDTMFPYPWSLFSTYPVPDAYITRMHKSTMDQITIDANFSTLITDIENVDDTNDEKYEEMFVQFKEVYASDIVGRNFKNINDLIVQLLSIGVNDLVRKDTIFQHDKEEKQTKQQKKSVKLNETDELAIEMVIRYGLQLRLIQSKNEEIESLKNLIHQTRDYLHIKTNEFSGFDWFISIIFILFNQNEKEAFPFLKNLSSTIHSVYLWMARFDNKEKLKSDSKIHPVLSNTCHYIELILQNELPQVYAAFRLSSYPPSQICQHWLRQCFLNYLDWSDILWYISTCIVMGVDYQVYFVMSIFKHLQNDILRHTQDNDLVVFLKNTPIKQFHVTEYMEFMRTLERKYREELLKDLHDL